MCARLDADKLVFFVDQLLLDNQGKEIRQASARDVERLVSLSTVRLANDKEKRTGQVNARETRETTIEHAVEACRQGIERVHLLRNDDPDLSLIHI